MKREGAATFVLIGLNILVFVAAAVGGVSPLAPSIKDLLRWGADFGPMTVSGEWWRLATSMFLHAGIIHLAFNMWCLLNLGLIAERWFGRLSFLILYVLSGIGGSLASLFMHPTTVSVGASGAIFGLAGGLIAFVGLRREAAPAARVNRLLPSLLSFVAYNLVFGSLNPAIDNAAHVGGLLVGAGFGAALLAGSATAIGGRRLALTTAGFGAVLLVSAGAVAKRAFPPRPSAARVRADAVIGDSIAALEDATAGAPDSSSQLVVLARLYLQGGRSADALRLLDRATRARPGDAAPWRLVGTAHLNARRFDAAIAAFDTLARLAPRDRAARYDLTFTYLMRGNSRAGTGDAAGAAADFGRVVDMNADSALSADARRSLRALRH